MEKVFIVKKSVYSYSYDAAMMNVAAFKNEILAKEYIEKEINDYVKRIMVDEKYIERLRRTESNNYDIEEMEITS